MKIFDILQNTVFDGCNVECYSFWIKKRVLVYEYGPRMQGKIKLSLEPEKEEGALIYNFPKCALSTCGSGFDAMFIFRQKEQKEFSISLVVTKEKISEQDIENLINNLSLCKQKITTSHIHWKAIIATENDITPKQKQLLQHSFEDIYLGKYSDYIGREIELFIKKPRE